MRSVAPGSAIAATASLAAAAAASCGRLTEQVAVERVADLGDRPAREERDDPPLLPDDVVDQGADVPVRARGRADPSASSSTSSRRRCHSATEWAKTVATSGVISIGTSHHSCPSALIVRRCGAAVERRRGGASLACPPVSTVPRFVLASSSPARLKLLRQVGIEPEVVVSGVDESTVTGPPADVALTLAVRKATAVARGLSDALVLGCDSVLDLDGEALGKPARRRRRRRAVAPDARPQRRAA